jgi:hypothetical protein
MDVACDQPLSGSAFSGDEYGRIRVSDALDQGANLTHLLVPTEQGGQPARMRTTFTTLQRARARHGRRVTHR